MTTGRIIRVRGRVQGVGFRPFVWQLATAMGLRGDVRNDAQGVLIRVSGADLNGFEAALRTKAPPLARIEALESAPGSVPDCVDFTIAPSGPAGSDTGVPPDAAICADCLAEIDTPGTRRFGYAFTNCTRCGPRYSILTALPYDRAQTSMAPFPMCPACRAEYADPADRRFHAQPIACPDCGPRLWFEAQGAPVPGDPITQAARVLADGGIVAIKGLGGFHLACDARNPQAIATLRTRKHRPAKPFALMAPLDQIRRHASLSDAEAALLADPAAPIVLLSAHGAPLPEGLAPGLTRLGWMLPATPLHHLLCARFGAPLVMTSGNASGAPMVTDNDAARAALTTIADGFLMHDRAIARRLDDGVEQVTACGPMALRRGRGRAPETLPLPPRFRDAPPVIAYGGQMKSAICLTKGGRALLSQHLGDLQSPAALDAFLQADRDCAALFDHRPHLVAVDLHPGYAATQHGQARAQNDGLRLEAVQHHHAHAAAALGEAGWDGAQAVAIVMDGLGLGTDGTIWGGEVLLGDYAQMRRVGGLTPAPLLGGDRAQTEPWRNALVRLDAAGLGELANRLFAAHLLADARRAVAGGLGTVPSSSAGRLFDAVAACLGICPARQSYEGEAAMRLEALAATAPRDCGAYPMDECDGQLDPAPLFRALTGDLATRTPPAIIAARFHHGLARAFARLAAQVADRAGTRTIALSGGCFQNTLLLDLTTNALSGHDLCLPHRIPANDGGLAFGQALVALARAQEHPA